MEQRNEQLKQTLIKQYSKLSHTSEFKLTEKLKNNDWWDKESSRLKVQRNVFSIVSCCIFLCLCAIFFITLKRPYNVPLASFLGILFPLFFVIKMQAEIGEKIRLFELMQISFDNKKSEVHHS